MARLKDPKTLLVIAVTLGLVVASRVFFAVPLPHVQLQAEPIPGAPVIAIPLLGNLAITNTMVAVLLTDVVLIILAILTTRRLTMVPGRLQNVCEAVIEWWHNQSVQMIGDDLTRRWSPLVLTVFLLVLVSNWFELIPGYDTIGILHQPRPAASGAQAVRQPETLFHVRWLGEVGRSVGVVTSRQKADQTAAPGQVPQPAGWAFVPILRAAATDLNFTVALALICFVSVEIVGLRVGGVGYIRKFIQIDFSRGLFMGVLNIFVGLLEAVSELVRIISYSFRLFGNLFAGQMLLFVIPFLVPLLAVPVYGLELFVGLIQAFVFAILTLAFMSVAIVSHHGAEHP